MAPVDNDQYLLVRVAITTSRDLVHVESNIGGWSKFRTNHHLIYSADCEKMLIALRYLAHREVAMIVFLY